MLLPSLRVSSTTDSSAQRFIRLEVRYCLAVFLSGGSTWEAICKLIWVLAELISLWMYSRSSFFFLPNYGLRIFLNSLESPAGPSREVPSMVPFKTWLFANSHQEPFPLYQEGPRSFKRTCDQLDRSTITLD